VDGAVAEGGSFGAGATEEAPKAKLLPLEAAATVESCCCWISLLEAAAVKTTPVDVDVAKPPQNASKNAVGMEADAIKSAAAKADATAATIRHKATV
jgi:hypothetical protein